MEQDERLSFNVKTSNGFSINFKNIGLGNSKPNNKNQSTSQLRRDQLRTRKYNLKKSKTDNDKASGNPEGSNISQACENQENLNKSEVQYVTGQWLNAPEDSTNFNTLFKPIYVGVERMLNFQEGIPSQVESNQNKTPFLVTFKMKPGKNANFLNNLENWANGIRNVRIDLRASLK